MSINSVNTTIQELTRETLEQQFKLPSKDSKPTQVKRDNTGRSKLETLSAEDTTITAGRKKEKEWDKGRGKGDQGAKPKERTEKGTKPRKGTGRNK